MGRGTKSGSQKKKPGASRAIAVEAPPAIEAAPEKKRLARLVIASAVVPIGGAIACTALFAERVWWVYLATFGLALLGLVGIALGGSFAVARIDKVRPDPRRWIYGGLAALFTIIYAVIILKVIPNRYPSAAIHLWSIPVFTLLMAAGTLLGRPEGWWIAVVGGSAILLSTIFVIVRILASAAFLAGTYGAFGKAASSFAMVSVALIVELVALLPICCVRWLMSRRGRRAYGIAA